MINVEMQEKPSIDSSTQHQSLQLAKQMESDRQALQQMLLADNVGIGFVIAQYQQQTAFGMNVSDVVSKSFDSPNIVQDSELVQLPVNTNLYLLADEARNTLTELRFLPSFLSAVARLYLISNNPRNDQINKLRHAAQALEDSRQLMIASNMGLVTFVANKYKTVALSRDDLVQEGVVGLIKAVDRFDAERGYQFSTYAVHWIKQAISRLILKQEKTVRLPMSLAEKASVLYETMREHYLKTERWPTITQLQALSDLSEEEIKVISQYYQANHSLDSVTDDMDEDDGMVLMERMKQSQFAHPLDDLTHLNLTDYINGVVDSLPEKEACILKMRFGLKNQTEMTLQAIADQLHVTRERVRQIQNRALKNLKTQFGCDLALFLESQDNPQ